MTATATHRVFPFLASLLATSASAQVWIETADAPSFPDGPVVLLAPMPDPDSAFMGFSGDPDCADGQLTMTSSSSCMASFGPGGVEMGTNDFRISEMGTDGDPADAAEFSAVAYNSNADEYLVVWRGYVNGEFEIYGQRLDSEGQQIGTNDIRVSDMGPDGDGSFSAHSPAIAFNPVRNEYLVVWSGRDTTGGGHEIYGQLLDGAGEEFGTNDFRISDMGPDGESFWHAFLPDVTYDETYDRYLVVWEGDDQATVYDVFGQCVEAATGAEFGTNDFVISVTGSGSYFDDLAPATACNPDWERCVVVWQATQIGGPGVQEFEIAGRAISSSNCEPLGPHFYVSDMGQSVSGHGAYSPDIVYNPDADEYLVVWVGDDDSGDLVNGEFEVFGQRILGAAGDEPGPWDIGVNDLRISDMGPDADVSYAALAPAVAYDATVDRYLVVWDGDDDAGGIGDNELEIFGQLLSGASGTAVGPWNFRLSDMGPDGDTDFAGRSPAVVAGGFNRFLVAWDGDDDSGPLVENEFEVFGQLVAGSDTYELLVSLTGSGEGKVTSIPPGIDCGSDCDELYDLGTVVTLTPTADPGSTFDGWSGDPDCSNGQVTMDAAKTCIARFYLLVDLIFSDGFESGDTSAWSSTVHSCTTEQSASAACPEEP